MKNRKNLIGVLLIIFGILCVLGDLNVITFKVDDPTVTAKVVIEGHEYDANSNNDGTWSVTVPGFKEGTIVDVIATDDVNDADMDETIDAIVDASDELELDDVEVMAHAVPLHNVFREDETKPSLDHDLALSNAPEEEDGYFKVPRVVQE